MRRLALSFIFVILLAASGFAGGQQPDRPAAQAERQNQVQQLIMDLYVSQFQAEVQLSEDQFLRIGTFVRQFIQMRFRAANLKQNLDQRLNELLSQKDPSENEVQRLTEEKFQFERNVANSENNLLTRIRPELTARQVTLVFAFNKMFFEERLPQLLERARASVAPRGQPPAQRPNNRDAARPGDAFRPPQ
jgi:hypothetical protein